ncbi:MAG: carboxypeptidase-like regulatory domain-containing protein [Candidatus Symbiothrix sp.]|jgi:hypothetical protein|nr:carboxypeptidase-like regulatory domain-containing protein [Candidatus Symbiothrix sp.]
MPPLFARGATPNGNLPTGISEATQQEQDISVTGIVIDEKGETLPGVSISVKGSPRGVATDVDGSFSIRVKPEDVLIVTFLGYQKLEVKVGAQKHIQVSLKPKTNELDEVTIVAFGKQKKESVIGSITTLYTRYFCCL